MGKFIPAAIKNIEKDCIKNRFYKKNKIRIKSSCGHCQEGQFVSEPKTKNQKMKMKSQSFTSTSHRRPSARHQRS